MARWLWLVGFGPLLLGCGGDSDSDKQLDAGSGGSAGASGTGGSGGGAGSGGSGGSGASAGAGAGCGQCDFKCCGTRCVNTDNDLNNCGGCGIACTGNLPYCDHGTCRQGYPCDAGTICTNADCCGSECCALGEICCNVPGPVGERLGCSVPTSEGSCPAGCTSCKCNSPDTPIATPSGDQPIAALQPGDLVYSVHRGAIALVPLASVQRTPALNHHVVELSLENGRRLRVSPAHPTADGRTFGELRAGQSLDGVRIRATRLVRYTHRFTYDILPRSDSGTYYAAGVLIGSTLM